MVKDGNIQAVVRAAEILRFVAAAQGPVGVSQASAALDIERTTTHRYFNTLEDVGLLERNGETAQYGLGPLVEQLCVAILERRQIITRAAGRLREIASETRATAVLSLWSGSRAVVIHVEYPHDAPVSVRLPLGYRIELDGAQSVLFLGLHPDRAHVAGVLDAVQRPERAALERRAKTAREEQFAEHATDTDMGRIRVLAAPVFDTHGLCATVGVVSSAGTLGSGRDSPHALALIREAVALSGEMGGEDFVSAETREFLRAGNTDSRRRA